MFQGEKPDHTYQSTDDKDNVYVFRAHNFTLAVRWSTHLVHVEYKQVTWPDNSTDEVAHIHLDKLDKAWTELVPGVDIMQMSTGIYKKPPHCSIIFLIFLSLL